ncbi:hypothetical protein RHMOL_Rhmol05G0296800 [Rhododendron molle]|uniref:Uncharacterized protein n=1 Tax=Rhododendron molle TaxID=49168 RepID=A0ACC0NWH2_RHOML|nr:hypothetical protein RHMOL_Rhmol05G0296800 [Rhododendron molle]
MGAKAMNYCGFGVCRSRKRKTETQAEEIVTSNVRLFSYNSLRSATRDFHPSNKIGGGGFGVVHMGVLRDGTCIAVKRLSAESKQGTKEFLTEINMISKIRHPNLVELIGCCIEGCNRILVYEYLENNSLASALLDCSLMHHQVWYSKAVLLGVLKLRLWLLAWWDEIRGYLAPEYALLGQLTKKADVYSFGVLILEILSGRSSSKSTFGVDLLVLVEWAWKLREEGRLLDIVDPLLTEYPEDEVIRFIKVALFCTQAACNQRPGMKQVVEMLSKEVILNEKLLTEPGVHLAHTSRGLVGDGSRVTSHFTTQMSQMAWKLREEGRLLDIVDPELTEYPEDEVIRFIKVALFCTQAACNQRPGMKQVVEMLSKEVTLNEKLLTEPGVHLAHTSQGLVGDSSRVTSHFATQTS